METPAQDFYDLLVETHDPPCLSLYQPTHRHHPSNRQDPIRFRNLLGRLQAMLTQSYPRHDTAALMEPLHALAGNRQFWNTTLDGLAVLAGSGMLRIYRLQRWVPERALVADSFHFKPLIRILQSTDRYQLLALTLRSARLFEGNRDVIDEVPLDEAVPRTLEDALGSELTEPYFTGSSRTSSRAAIFHGHGSKKDEQPIDTERFFRAVDRGIWLHHSRPSGLPLFLVALPEHQAGFHRVSHNPLLAKTSISANPEALDSDALRELGWAADEPRYLALTRKLIDRFRFALAKGQGSDRLTEVATAAAHARVATLIVDADHHIPGRVDFDDGRIDAAPADEADDLLDDLSELVMKRGGRAVVVPRDRMPSPTGVAAIYRY